MELVMIWRETVLTYFKVLSQNSSREMSVRISRNLTYWNQVLRKEVFKSVNRDTNLLGSVNRYTNLLGSVNRYTNLLGSVNRYTNLLGSVNRYTNLLGSVNRYTNLLGIGDVKMRLC
jgi:hypothetical protein